MTMMHIGWLSSKVKTMVVSFVEISFEPLPDIGRANLSSQHYLNLIITLNQVLLVIVVVTKVQFSISLRRHVNISLYLSFFYHIYTSAF